MNGPVFEVYGERNESVMAYDRLDCHSGADYNADLPEENGGIHIGMFLAWAFGRGLVGAFHREESTSYLERLERREITGLDILLEACDGKFWEEDLDERGNAFAVDYYEDQSDFAAQYGSYLNDYCDVFNRHAEEQGFEYASLYHVENNWDNFERLKAVLDERYAQWEAWAAIPSNRQLDPKTQWLQACQRIGEVLLQPQGYKANKAGNVWKKTADDKDTTLELTFEPERYNTRLDVRLSVSMRLLSKKLKRWQAERSINGDGTILYGSLRRVDKAANKLIWQIAGSDRESALQEIADKVRERILPLLELYADRPRALEQLAAQDGSFPGLCEAEPTPLAFLLCFGTQEQAQRFFTHYVQGRPSPWRRNIHKTFERLQAGESWDYAAYHREHEIKLAFHNGLTLPG